MYLQTHFIVQRARLALAAAGLALLAACGGGDAAAPAAATPAPPATVQLTGVAATGAAISGAQVTVTNASGAKATGSTAADGSFTVSVADVAPFVLTITDAAGQAWYSYAQAAGRANITPLTTLALLQANGGKPLADLVAQWASAPLSADTVLAAARTTNANLRALMQANGVNPASVNVFAQEFAANRTGLDAVLDAMRVSITCSAGSCSQSITSPAGSVLVAWNGNIATTGITLSWSATTAGTAGGTTGGTTTGGSVTVGLGSCKAPVAGTWSMVVSTAVSGFGGIAIPEICVDGLPGAPSSQAEFCGDATAQQQLPPGAGIVSCSFANNVGTIVARITAPLALDYTLTYTFVKR